MNFNEEKNSRAQSFVLRQIGAMDNRNHRLLMLLSDVHQLLGDMLTDVPKDKLVNLKHAGREYFESTGLLSHNYSSTACHKLFNETDTDKINQFINELTETLFEKYSDDQVFLIDSIPVTTCEKQDYKEKRFTCGYTGDSEDIAFTIIIQYYNSAKNIQQYGFAYFLVTYGVNGSTVIVPDITNFSHYLSMSHFTYNNWYPHYILEPNEVKDVTKVSLLRRCAISLANFFDLESPDYIVNLFNSIAELMKAIPLSDKIYVITGIHEEDLKNYVPGLDGEKRIIDALMIKADKNTTIHSLNVRNVYYSNLLRAYVLDIKVNGKDDIIYKIPNYNKFEAPFYTIEQCYLTWVIVDTFPKKIYHTEDSHFITEIYAKNTSTNGFEDICGIENLAKIIRGGID